MLIANLVAECLVAGEFPNVFPGIGPSAFDCEEPIVVIEDAFGRESRIEGEERGTVPVTVLVVREMASEAEDVAVALESFVRNAEWEPFAEAGPWRVVGMDTTAPGLRERDSSGRYVWEFTVKATVVREI